MDDETVRKTPQTGADSGPAASLLPLRLRPLRQARGLTQQAVASALGIDRTTYAKYESGANEPPIAMLTALARLFGVTVDYLVGNSDDPQGIYPLTDIIPVGMPPLEELTPQEREVLDAYARLLVSQRRKKL